MAGNGDDAHAIHGGSIVLLDVQFDAEGLLNTLAQLSVVVLEEADSLR
jgi:hypothetical protein